MPKRNFVLYNSWSDGIKYSPLIILQHTSAVAVVVHLWKQNDVKEIFIDFFNSCHKETIFSIGVAETCRKVEAYIIEKLHKLMIPKKFIPFLSEIVRNIGAEVSSWIIFLNYYIICCSFKEGFNPSLFESSPLNYLEDIVWNSGGFIDYDATSKNLLAESAIKVEYKFLLACTFCLEKDISFMMPRVVYSGYLKRIDFAVQPMVYYWICRFNEDNSELIRKVDTYNIIEGNNFGTNEAIFHFLTSDYYIAINQIAIRYMWNQLAKEERERNLANVLKRDSNVDFSCFLLSEMDYEQQQNVFKYAAGVILKHLLRSKLWKSYFLPTMQYARNVISVEDFIEVSLEVLIMKAKNGVEYYDPLSMFQELWLCAPGSLKKSCFDAFQGSGLLRCIYTLLPGDRNGDLTRLVLSYGTAVQRKRLLLTDCSLVLCSHMLKEGNWNVFETYVVHCISSEEDLKEFKQMFSQDHITLDIAVELTCRKEWNHLERYLKWLSRDVDATRNFRWKLANQTFLVIVEQCLREKSDFDSLNHYLMGCLASKNIANDFRNHLFQNSCLDYGLCKFICHQLERCNFEIVDDFLNWRFEFDPKKVRDFKNCFLLDDVFHCADMLIDDVVQNDSENLILFVRWSFGSPHEISQFRNYLLNSDCKSMRKWSDLLQKYYHVLDNSCTMNSH